MEADIYKMNFKIENRTDNLRIIGEDFMTNNKNKAKLIIINKKYPLKSIIKINDIKKYKIKIILNKNIYNKSCMFKNCESLESLTYFSLNNNEEELENKENMYDKGYDSKITETENNKVYLINQIIVLMTLLFIRNGKSLI